MQDNRRLTKQPETARYFLAILSCMQQSVSAQQVKATNMWAEGMGVDNRQLSTSARRYAPSISSLCSPINKNVRWTSRCGLYVCITWSLLFTMPANCYGMPVLTRWLIPIFAVIPALTRFHVGCNALIARGQRPILCGVCPCSYLAVARTALSILQCCNSNINYSQWSFSPIQASEKKALATSSQLTVWK